MAAWYSEFEPRILAALPATAEDTLTAVEIAAQLDIPDMAAMAALTALYLGGDAEKIFAEPLGSADSRYYRLEVSHG